MATPTPFRVTCPPHLLDRLHEQLRNARFPDDSLAATAGGETWEYGMPNRVARKLIDHWITKYDWSTWERRINTFSHFTLEVAVPVGASPGDPRGTGSVKVHFIHERSERQDAVPLIMTHGWPGSVVEFLNVIRPLTHPPPDQPAFHVVCPSLIGYGFSTPATVRDFGLAENARVFDKLMGALGYDSYMAQGGDWGSLVTKALGILFPTRCKAIHLNMPTFRPPPPSANVAPPTPSERKRMDEAKEFQVSGTGYQRIQATKPQTLGFALSDSPVGLLAWIGEKFHEWVDLKDGDGDFSPTVDADLMLTNVMLYYMTNTITSSFFLYHHQLYKQLDVQLLNSRLTVPVACPNFPCEIFACPKSWAEYWCDDLAQWNVFEKGGHFAAMERPGDLVGDVRAFAGVGRVRKAFGVGNL